MAMPPPGSGANHQPPPGGESIDLRYRGAAWAHVTLDDRRSYVSLCCPMPSDPYSFPVRVSMQIESGRKITCTVYANGSNVPSPASRLVLHHNLGEGKQKLALVDAAGGPWAEVELLEELRLFDLAGRERVRVTSEWSVSGRHFKLHCVDEAGQPVSGQQFLMV